MFSSFVLLSHLFFGDAVAATTSVPMSAWLAVEIEEQQQMNFQADKVVALLTEACDSGHKSSCRWKKAREKLPKAPNGQVLYANRVAYFSDLCVEKDPWGCVVSGWHDTQQEHIPGIAFRSADNWDRGYLKTQSVCSALEWRPCLEMAKLDLLDTDTSTRIHAVQIITEACTNQDAQGCFLLGIVQGEGVEMVSSPSKAEHSFRFACEHGLAKACTELGLVQLATATDFADASKVVSLYQQACEGGSTTACSSLGYHYEQGLGVDRNLVSAVQYYQLACTNHYPEACDKLGVLYSEGRGVKLDKTKAEELFSSSCDAGNPFACYNLAAMWEQQKRIEDAREKLAIACGYGSGRACFTYGLWAEKGKGGPVALDVATTSYHNGCQLEYALACVNGGILEYTAGRTIEAGNLYKDGCAYGNLAACASYALLLETGDGVTQDVNLARELYKQACDGGDERACHRWKDLQGSVDDLLKQCTAGKLSSCYDAAQRLETQGLSPGDSNAQIVANQQKAFTLVSGACAKGHQLSCVKQAYYYLEAIGTTANQEKAFALYDTACSKREAKGCHAVGLMYAEGRYVSRDTNKAIEHLRMACGLEEGNSCAAAAYLARTQNPPDFQSSLELSRQGCAMNNLDACAQEAYIYTQSPRQDYAQAVSLFKTNCAKNHAKSCYNYAAMLHHGQGIEANPAEAYKVMEYACLLGDEQACQVIK